MDSKQCSIRKLEHLCIQIQGCTSRSFTHGIERSPFSLRLRCGHRGCMSAMHDEYVLSYVIVNFRICLESDKRNVPSPNVSGERKIILVFEKPERLCIERTHARKTTSSVRGPCMKVLNPHQSQICRNILTTK